MRLITLLTLALLPILAGAGAKINVNTDVVRSFGVDPPNSIHAPWDPADPRNEFKFGGGGSDVTFFRNEGAGLYGGEFHSEITVSPVNLPPTLVSADYVEVVGNDGVLNAYHSFYKCDYSSAYTVLGRTASLIKLQVDLSLSNCTSVSY